MSNYILLTDVQGLSPEHPLWHEAIKSLVKQIPATLPAGTVMRLSWELLRLVDGEMVRQSHSSATAIACAASCYPTEQRIG